MPDRKTREKNLDLLLRKEAAIARHRRDMATLARYLMGVSHERLRVERWSEGATCVRALLVDGREVYREVTRPAG